MKKIFVSIVLGIALFTANGSAFADQGRSSEPRWGIRSDRRAAPSPLDLARWLARHLAGAVSVPLPAPWEPTLEPSLAPAPAPGTIPAPSDLNEVCVPERGHCPVG